ncbi:MULTISPECIES: hypothetical protein [Pseudomonas]|uniref:Uncharacterized protein n=1 Tax=Pseudomonas fluorescens TaxID=294 RepID=A0A166QKV9_PSEFL|nr:MULTISPECIES: hypothetical protein [Pseudomonas]KZN20441.1 hypothetical protein A1D17_02560 [Pseudomonas fluorescens]
MNDSTKTTKEMTFPDELIPLLGIIPDAVMSNLVEALSLNGRDFATLKPDQLKIFDFFQKQGQKYGVVATLVGAEKPEEQAVAGAQAGTTGTVSVVLS